VWYVSPIYNDGKTFYYASDEAYYSIPHSDIKLGRVSPEDFQLAQQAAKRGEALGESDIGQVLGCSQPVKKCEWKEVTPKSKGPMWKEVTSD
jgi:hypothetical protein